MEQAREDTKLLIDLYIQAKQVHDRFVNNEEPAFRAMAEDVHTSTGDMLEGMGIGFWNDEGGMAFYKDVYK